MLASQMMVVRSTPADRMYFPFLFHFSAKIGPLCWPNTQKISTGTKFLITKFLITEFLITKFKFLIDKVSNHKVLK